MSTTAERDRTQHRDFGHNTSQNPPIQIRRLSLPKRWLLGVVFIPACGLLLLSSRMLVNDLGQPDQPLIYCAVQRGDLPITVTERGNLESQHNIEIACEVDDVPGDGISGTTIVWIVPNGASVKKGDLMVELDSSSHQERLDRQILHTETARERQILAQTKYENQKTQNETNLANAQLQVKLAELDLEMFTDPKKGTHELEKKAIERSIEDTNNEILAAQANLELKRNDKFGVETLFKLGYAGKSELDRSRLGFLQAESQYAAKINELTTQLAALDKKEDYEKRMQLLKLHGTLDTRKRDLTQVSRDNEARLEQARAAKEAAEESLRKEEELLARYREQLDNCKIYAPETGMVAYAVPPNRYYGEIREGATVRPRQHILSLPNLQKMQVKTAVHESVLDEVKIATPATVRVDAFPDSSYQGTVQSVAVLPDQNGWMSSDTKVYSTVITIDQDVVQLKPGMTAVVEIHVDRLNDVLTVPVQAIVQVEDESWCYVQSSGTVERRAVALGRTNDKLVEVREGIEQGDQVVLNPMAIVDNESGQSEPDRSEERESSESGNEDTEGLSRSTDAEASLAQASARPTGRTESVQRSSQP